MPTPPPVPTSARYPLALRDFVVYQDQPGDGNHIITTVNLDGTTTITDLTIDKAAAINDLHTEIASIEKTVGVNPPIYGAGLVATYSPRKMVMPSTVGTSIWFLYNYKSFIGHTHMHPSCSLLTNDDHPQYMPVNASRGFSHTITSPPAAKSNQLMTWGQVNGIGVTSSTVQNMIDTALDAMPVVTSGQAFRIMGGVASGNTDTNGNLWVPFGSGFASGVLTFVYMKMPYPGGSTYGYTYQYEEDQLVLLSISNKGALIQFIEDIVVDRQAWVSMCWIAVGL